jgi:long-chain acyl-CoA synthetase
MSGTAAVPREAAPASAYEWAERYPDRPAFAAADGATTTFGELGDRVNRLSNALRALGIGAGGRLALQLLNCQEYIEVALATGQIGALLVPLSTHLSPAEAEYILSDSQASALVADLPHARALSGLDAVSGLTRLLVGGKLRGWHGFETALAGSSAARPEGRVAGSTMGYTSGTSGRPKGVLRQVRQLPPEEVLGAGMLRFLGAFGLAPGDGRHLACSPLYHAAPFAFAQGSLHLGHQLVCMPKFDARRVLESIERFSVTSTHMVPTHFQRLLALPDDERAARDVSSMRLLIHAGAPCPPEAKRKMLEWFGPVVWEYYGATEGTVSIASPDDAMARPGTVGRPLPYVDVKVMDSAGRELPPGEEGLVYFSTPTGPHRYHGDEAKTRESRIGDYATIGDIGWLDGDGYLFLADRREDMINTGGVNVYPAEVEHRLLEHPAVADVAVVGQPDQEWGERIVAFVTTVPGTVEGPELAGELQAHCRAGIARLKCPRAIYFRTDLPRTETGKLLRRVLRAEITENTTKEGHHAGAV